MKSKMTRVVLTGFLSAVVGGTWADGVTNPNGLLTAAGTEDIQAAVEASGSDGLVLGNGMLKWTGGDATWPAPSASTTSTSTACGRPSRSTRPRDGWTHRPPQWHDTDLQVS